LTELQSKIYKDSQNFDACQSSCSTSIPGNEELRSHASGFMNTSGASNESCSSVTTSDSSNQILRYLSANTPRKQKMAIEMIKSGKQEIKNLNKDIVSLSQQLSNYDTEEHFLRLSEKYLSPGLCSIVKSQINLKEKQKEGYRYNNEIKQL